MDAGIVIALILGVASVISSICFGLVPGVRKNKIEKLEKKVHDLAQDIDSFYAIEQILLEKLSKETGTNVITMKKEIRKTVRQEKGRTLSDYANPSKIAQYL